VAQNQFRLRLRGLHIGRTLSGGAQAGSIYQRSAKSSPSSTSRVSVLDKNANKLGHAGARSVKSASIASVEGRRAFLAASFVSLVNSRIFYRKHGNASRSICRLCHPEWMRSSKRRSRGRPTLSQTAPRAHVRTRDRGELKNYARTRSRSCDAHLRARLSLPSSVSHLGYRLHRASSNLRVRFVTRECEPSARNDTRASLPTRGCRILQREFANAA